MRYSLIKTILNVLTIILTLIIPIGSQAETTDTIPTVAFGADGRDSFYAEIKPDSLIAETTPVSPYALPYSVTGNTYDWHRLWMNTAVLSGAFCGTLLVLECLPEDATTWNRAELQDVPLFRRWYNHVMKKGPEWDHDKFYFNYILHPYAGAVYFMSARSCGFNFWRSALYGSIVSTVGWEFGIEAFMERPSIQDIFVTPIVGSCMGEGFYQIKRWLVDNDYSLFGSSFLGGVLAFIVDPVNEFTGLWMGNPARDIAHGKTKDMRKPDISVVPSITRSYKGFSLVGYF